MVEEFASKNLVIIGSERMALHICNNIIHMIYQKRIDGAQEMQTVQYSKENVMKTLSLTTVSIQFSWCWLKLVGYNYSANVNYYFCDKHKEPVSVTVLYRI